MKVKIFNPGENESFLECPLYLHGIEFFAINMKDMVRLCSALSEALSVMGDRITKSLIIVQGSDGQAVMQEIAEYIEIFYNRQ